MAPPTPDEAKQLIRRYEPILYLHPDEKFVPVRPETYIEHSALWHSQPASDDKRDWGNKPPTGDFPRSPLIPKKGISVNPAGDTEGTADIDGDGVNEWYLGHRTTDGRVPYLDSDSERELFFDFAGWADSEKVTDTSENKSSNKDKAVERYEKENLLKNSRFWYYAEVDNLDSLTNLIALIRDKEGINLEVIWDVLTSKAYIIWYYFLYPHHEEITRHCGDVIGAGSDGSYEGDWAAVAIIVRDPFGPAVESPEFVGFSMRERGLPGLLPGEFRQLMKVQPWRKTVHEGRHVKIYVARGSHNNYRLEGPKNPPGYNVTSATCEAITNAEDEVKKKLDDLNEELDTVKDTLITVAKIGAGCGIGAIFGGWIGCGIGAIVGGIAGLIEGAVNDSDDSSESVDERGREQSERDYAPDVDNYGTVISPADLVSTLPEQPPKSRGVERWAGSPEDKLVNRNLQIWWPGMKGQPGYSGRWGVRVQDDPRDRRSGIMFPDFKRAFLIDLALQLSQE